MLQTQDLPIVELPDKTDSAHSGWDAIKGLSFDDAITTIANGVVQFAFKLLVAAFVFYLGKFIIRKIFEVVRKILIANDVDASLMTFVLSLVRIVLYFILIVTIVGILGIETSSFLAIFASAGVAIGMALSGTLQNFAGGVLILLLKPYKVGDYIEAQGFAGYVKEIQIFHTVINTMDNKYIIIPNGGLSTGSINNYSSELYRRVDWKIGLCYGCNYKGAKDVFMELLLEDPRVVTGTLQEDWDKRKALKEELTKQQPENDCPPDDPDCEEENLSLWQRLIHRKKRRQEAIKKKIEKKTTLPSTTNLNVKKPPFVAISELADSSVIFAVRAWTHNEDYWNLYFDMLEKFYDELPKRGFGFPFPQMDVHLADVPPELTMGKPGVISNK
ncbi:MAG: mechanosensitive ion channel [Muribaculaceae bacterium]|nr:mechanosensitive ion channel [Muribaculaceae bacterium]